MLEILISPIPSQSIQTTLDGQICEIVIYQKSQGLFVDVSSNGVQIVSAVIAQDANPIICRDYAGFSGNLLFIDTQGNQDPEYSGLGSRFSLVYLNAEENALISE